MFIFDGLLFRVLRQRLDLLITERLLAFRRNLIATGQLKETPAPKGPLAN